MAIQWGAWEYSGGNGMRVGIEVDLTSVSHGSSSCTVTFKIYTQNQYSYSDSQSLGIDGTTNWSNVSFTNNDGSGSVRRTTKTYKYNFDSNDYGSGTAKTVTCNVALSGAYNGVTPSKSVSVNIPKRPIDNPATPTSVNASRVSDSSATVTWTRHDTNGEPYEYQRIDRWDNVTNAYDIYDSNFSGGATSHTVATSANRRYRFRVYAHNGAGWSGGGYSEYMQTTPASPSGCSASKSSTTSVLISWANGASSQNGYEYDTLLEEQVDGGAWTQIATIAAGTSSYNRTGRAAGSVYAYRVRHRSTVDSTTYSSYSTSGTIQLQSPPAAPTVVSTVRTNDNSFTLNWTNNPNGDVAPYDSLTVQRWDNTSGAWQTIGSLASTATSVTDTGTVVNRAYQWRIAANNAAGSSEWAYFDTFQTRPADPTEVKAKAAPGGAISVSWINNASYPSYTTTLRYFKNGVLVTDTISLAAGETSYLLEGVDLTATYQFGVKTVSTVGYTSESEWVDGASMAASTVPNAPTNLAPSGEVRDLLLDQGFTWTHNPSLDESDQTAFEIQYSTDGGTTWATTGQITDTASSWTMPGGTLANGPDVTWQVRTWGVNATASPWSATALFQTSTTPTVSINEPATGVLTTSTLNVVWAYNDAEATPQAHWELELYDDAGSLLEAENGDGETSSFTMETVIIDGKSYVLRVRVQDGDGLRTAWVEKNLLAQFTPPAVPSVSADYAMESGVTVITLTPTPDDGGATTLPAVAVDLQRRLLQRDTETWGEWETLAAGVADDATLIDTTAPIANDGEYRIIAYSDAPSAKTSDPEPPSGYDDRWVYLSGGPNFQRVCRLMGNIALRTTTTRERELYNFAGRSKPVMFVGEATGRVIDVAGLLDAESSSPAEWEALIATSDVLLFRDPLGHRIYGSVPQVAIDNLGNDMYALSFTVTEVSYP
jgi:hypothetical protein